MSPRRPRPPKDRPPDPDATTARWRLFVAVPLPAPVKALVASLVGDLAAEGWPVRWVHPDGAHLTLHFLGEIEPERAQLVRLALPPVVARHAAFDLRTAGLGVFPNLRRPRVLWLGLHGPGHRLDTLQHDLGAVLRGLGFPPDDAPFHPHVTLGRVRDQGSADFALRDLPEAIRRRLPDGGADAVVPPPLAMPVREVELVRSFLGRGGPRYEVAGRYPLATANGDRP